MAKVHYFVIEDAEKYGLKEAIVLQNFRHWLDRNLAEKDNIRDGRVWTYNSYTALAELFPYLSASQIKRIVQKLEDDGILISDSFNKFKPDRTKWYSINEPKYLILNNGQNRPIDGTKSSDGGSKLSDAMDEIVPPIPNNKPNNKQQIVNTDTYSLREKTDWFIDFWNKLYETNVRFTENKQRQVGQRLKVFDANEIVQALKNRSNDTWLENNGYMKDWDSFWRNNEKVERYLNKQTDNLPF